MSFLLNIFRRFFPDNSPVRLFYHKIIAMIAAVRYFFPGEKIQVIAVTGTNGKTTVCHMITAILMEAGKKVGMTTTVCIRIGDLVYSNREKQTTFGPFALQKLLNEMADECVNTAVIETTSHALVQSRLYGINVDTAVITNVSRDHIEYHGSEDAYLKAKSRLFSHINGMPRKPHTKKTAVLNRDDKSYETFNRYSYDLLVTYGLKGKSMVTASNVKFEPNKTYFTLKVPNQEIDIVSPFAGKFNLENALAAISVGLVYNIGLHTIKKGLESMPPVPGRLETIDEGQLFTIVVDYAHTPDALQKILDIYKPITHGKIIIVFGATGGGRDKSKRPEMGKIADLVADYIILTNDDPYFDDQQEIINDIAHGVKRKEGDNFWKVTDRKQAIRLALAIAKEQDTVIVAGKGGEEVIVIEDQKIPWDDRKVIRELLSREVRVRL